MPRQMRPSVSGPRWRIGRRGVLHATAAAVTGAALAGCGPRAAALRPAVVQTKIRLVAQVSWQGGTNFPGTAQELTDQFVATHWTSKHPGVEVRTEAGAGSNGPSAGTTPTIASVLAGAGPDIVVTCCSSVPTLLDSGILAPLNPLLKKDNVDTQSLFPASVLDQMTRSGVIYGLPDYGSTGPLFVNYSALDELGLPYPQPDWTAAEAETLWRSLAGRRNGKWVFGANLPILSGASAEWLVHGWGGAARTSGRTRCLLDSTECTSAYTYIADLAQAKVINPCLW